MALRVLLLLVRHPDLSSTMPLFRCYLSIARGWGVPHKSVVGTLRTLELLLCHLEQAHTFLDALDPALCPIESCYRRIGRHPVFPCILPCVPVHRKIWVHLVEYEFDQTPSTVQPFLEITKNKRGMDKIDLRSPRNTRLITCWYNVDVRGTCV